MGIKKVLRKLGNFLNHGNNPQHEKITPAEMELKSYERREYLDKVKQKVLEYRKQDSNTLLRGTPLPDDAPIFNTPQFGKKKKKSKPCNILGGKGGGLW